jgi:7-keto-8-aminopelargonate synthetase-like enzyme
MLDAVLGLGLFCGTISGALWGAAMEREEQEIARLFGRSMAFFYSLGFLAIVLSAL